MTETPTRPCFILNHSRHWHLIKPDNIEMNEKVTKGIRFSRNSQLYKIIGYNPLKITEEEI